MRSQNLKPVFFVSVVLPFLTILAGCTSVLNVGESEYGCTGMPDGVQCMSAREVYEATNDGSSGEQLVQQQTGSAAKVSSRAQEIEGEVINNYVAPNVPNKPIPVRTPAQVMRIWIAPWENTDGDLVVTGHIYTEIEPRRWVIGDKEPEGRGILNPLGQ